MAFWGPKSPIPPTLPFPRLLALTAGGLGLARISRPADGVARQDQFHAPILLPPLGRVIAGDGFGLPESVGFNVAGGNPLLHKVVPNRLGPALRELLIVVVAAHAVRMAFHGHIKTGIRQHNAGNFGQPFAGSRKQLEAAAAE